MSLTNVFMGIYALMIHLMINNNRVIKLAYFVAFNLNFAGRRPLHLAREPQFELS